MLPTAEVERIVLLWGYICFGIATLWMKAKMLALYFAFRRLDHATTVSSVASIKVGSRRGLGGAWSHCHAFVRRSRCWLCHLLCMLSKVIAVLDHRASGSTKSRGVVSFSGIGVEPEVALGRKRKQHQADL